MFNKFFKKLILKSKGAREGEIFETKRPKKIGAAG
jgi:hypothetical protein